MIDVKDIIGGPLSLKAQKQVSTILFTWLAERARLVAGEDLTGRLEQMRKDIEQMSKTVELGFEGGKVVVTVTGRGDGTLRQLKNGTGWFDPHPDVNGMIAIAALSS
jgi:hypothetical protein